MKQTRVADLMTRHSPQDVAREVLMMLPRDFVDMYEALFLRAFQGHDGTAQPPPDGGVMRAHGRGTRTRVTSSQTETIPSAHPSTSGTRAIGVASEVALEMKSRVDRKLRVIARSLRRSLNDIDDGSVRYRRCVGKCGKIGEADWNWCPRCGSPMGD